LIISMYL